MLTAQDIKKITAVVATKKDVAVLDKRVARIEKGVASSASKSDIVPLDKRMGKIESRLGGVEISIFATRQDMSDLGERISSFERKVDALLVSLDKTLGALDALRLEYAAVKTQLSRHEEWIKQIAEKTGVKLEY